MRTAPFSGELGLLSLFDLGQLLSLNGATGVLTIEQDGRKAYLYFHEGRIVNAVDPELREGEQAAYPLFGWQSGRFEFRTAHTESRGPIEMTSEGLILEAARMLDEQSAQDGQGKKSAVTGSLTEKLRERQGHLEALRDAFDAAVLDARSARGASPSDTLPAANMTRADDRTVFRPGHPVRMRLKGSWRESHDAAMNSTEYQDLARRLTSGPGVVTTPGGRIIARLSGGRAWSVTRVSEHRGESLWLRPVDLAPPERSSFSGKAEELEIIDRLSEGLLLVGGPDADSASQVLHALVASRGAQPECVVIAADHSVYRHRPPCGVVCEVEPATLPEALSAGSPSWLALDSDGPFPPGSFGRLGGTRVIAARASGSNPESWFARWRARLASSDAAVLDACLEGMPIVGVWSGGVASEGEPIALRAWTLRRADAPPEAQAA